MEKQEIIKTFGVDPDQIGNRPRGYWVVEKVEDEEASVNAKIGDLCVKTRDGGSNPIDTEALKKENCVGSSTDGFDCTYRYYYYKAI